MIFPYIYKLESKETHTDPIQKVEVREIHEYFIKFIITYMKFFLKWGAGTILFLFTMAVYSSPTIRTRAIPAVYKSPDGPKQEIQIIIEHKGSPVTAEISFNGEKKRQQLQTGSNICSFKIDEVKNEVSMPLTVTGIDNKYSSSVKVQPVRHWYVNMVQHTHTDIGYTRPQMEILAEHLRYIDYALDYCDATDDYPDFAKFRWTCEISWAISEYLKFRPKEQIERLKKRVKEGRIELSTMYLNFDELPDEQTLAASLYPMKQFQDNGMQTQLAMQDDVNGIGWCFSEYYADAGIRYLNMGTHGHRAIICFDKPTLFWWQSPSGKKMLAYRGEHYHMGNFFGVQSGNLERFENSVLNYLDNLAAKDYPYDVLTIQHSGYHTDNSAPSTRSSEMLLKWDKKYIWPKLRTAVATDLFKEVEKKYADKIQTIRGAWPDWWSDGYASGTREAAASRITHTNIIASQGGLSMASMMGSALPENVGNEIDDINKSLLFYDEHTFGYAGSVTSPYCLDTWEQRSVKESYAWDAYKRCGLLGEETMGILQQNIPQREFPTITVFNTLNWNYDGIAKIYIDQQQLPREKDFEILDAEGKSVPAQLYRRSSGGTYWHLYFEDVPALGYAQYTIHSKEAPAKAVPRETVLNRKVVENKWYRIEFNELKGTIKSLYDKELGTEILSQTPDWEMGEFIHEIIDSRHPMELRKYPQFMRRRPEKMNFEAFIPGAIWDTYRFRGETSTGIQPNNLMVEYRIYKVEKKIEVVFRLKKKPIIDPESVYVAFPFDVKDGKIFLDVTGGHIEAGVDQIKGSSNDWYTVQNYASIRNSKGQVIIGSQEVPLMQFGAINTGRYQAGATPQSTNIYSWPMNNYWVTNFNADQEGEMEWSYYITSSSDNSNMLSTRFSWGNRIPFLTRVLQAGKEKTSPLQPESLFRIVPENLLLVNMKPIKGEKAVMMQLREIAGKPAHFEIQSEKIRFSRAILCDVIGNPIKKKDALDFQPWESKFIKVSW